MSFNKIYSCWIVAMVRSYQDRIISGMVKKGYVVGPASKNLTTSIGEDSQPAITIALTFCNPLKDISSKQIYDDVSSIIIENNFYCYALIVSQVSDTGFDFQSESSWAGCNFDLNNKQKLLTNDPAPSKNELN